MPRISVKKSEVRKAGGFGEWCKQNKGLSDGVSLEKIADGGIYGNRIFVWDTPEGIVKVTGYVSNSIVSHYKMTGSKDVFETLFDSANIEEAAA